MAFPADSPISNLKADGPNAVSQTRRGINFQKEHRLKQKITLTLYQLAYPRCIIEMVTNTFYASLYQGHQQRSQEH